MSRFTGQRLTCIRGEREVFAGLDFALDAGEALLVTGPNGSGKSSLLRLMAGLGRPAAGTVAWDGASIADDRDAHAARLHYVGHLDAVKPALSVAENLAVWVRCKGAGATGVVDEALDVAGLAGLRDLPGRLLSAGQRRRLALARTVATPASLWLLDEPTTALDRESVTAFEDVVARHRGGGGLVVVATNVELAVAGARTIRLSGGPAAR